MDERLALLKKSLSNMTHEERLEKLREVREDRKISKHAVNVTKKRAVDKSNKLEKAFEGLSPEEKEQFIELLKEQSDEG